MRADPPDRIIADPKTAGLAFEKTMNEAITAIKGINSIKFFFEKNVSIIPSLVFLF